jgi:hypothetical protein
MIDTDTRAAAIGLHTIWGQTLGAVTASSAMRDLEDFLRLLERSTVIKLLAFDPDDGLAGVAFLTNELELVPGISSEFFHARYPTEIASGQLFYLISGVAHPARPGVLDGLRGKGVEAAHRRRAAVLVWDADSLHGDAVERTTVDAARRLTGSDLVPVELDRVSYMAIELPAGDDGRVIDLRGQD